MAKHKKSSVWILVWKADRKGGGKQDIYLYHGKDAIDVRMENLKYRPDDKKTVARLFEKLNFRTWLAELHQEKTEDIETTASNTEKNIPRDYQLITSIKQLEDWVKKISIAKLTAIDT